MFWLSRPHRPTNVWAVTVLEVIQKSAEFLEHKGVDSPRLQVELLLADLLQMPRLKLYLEFERVLTAEQVQALRERILQRGRRIPLQHLLGHTSFCGHDIEVNGDVLIPRPETEQLAARAIGCLSDHPPDAPASQCALDFGTGSGCLAIALAKALPSLHVDAIDVSAAALAVALRNIDRHQLAGRVRLHQGDGFAALPSPRRYALLVSNPPYIPSGEIDALQPEVRDHDPRGALDGGVDGLDFHRRLAAEAGPWLAADGVLMAEIGDGQDTSVRRVFEEAGWRGTDVFKDDNGIPRIFVACRPHS